MYTDILALHLIDTYFRSKIVPQGINPQCELSHKFVRLNNKNHIEAYLVILEHVMTTY